MRVLFVTHNFPRHEGDLPGNFLLRLAVALREADVSVQVLAPHAAGLADSDVVAGIPVSRYRYAPDQRETLAYGGTMADQVARSWRAKADLFGMIRAARRATAALAPNVDVVHAHWWFPSGLAVGRGHTRPVITTLHGSDVRFGTRTPVSRWLMRRALRRSTRLTAVSSWLAAQAAEVSGVNPLVAPMPADVELFTPRDNARRGLLFVGKIDAQKGLSVLLEALALLPEPVLLTVVGDGADAEQCRAQADSLGIGHRVTWAGARPQAALPDYYRRAELVVAPATAPEGLGLVAVEALLCETPVVASDAGGLRDVVEDGITGAIVPPGQPDALAQTIQRALASAEQRGEWGREGRRRVVAQFAPAACAKVYRTLYQETIDARA